jgi:hypothetical protein
MSKKAKVTKITKWERRPGYNDTSFTIEFDNGDKGFYSSKDEDQKRFVVGQEAEYNIEEKDGKNGKKYFRITSPLDPAPIQYRGAGGGGRPQIDPKVQMISFAAAYTKDLIVAGKIDIQSFGSQFNTIYNTMISKI